jgi:hypothetical protein
MEGLIKSDSMVTQLWGPITLKNLEDGDDTFSEMSALTRATWHKFHKTSIIDTAVKVSHSTKHPSMVRLINGHSMVTQLWGPIS